MPASIQEWSLLLLSVFALIIIAFCAMGIIRPANLLGFAANVIESKRGMWIAVGVRLIAGSAFLIGAPLSRLPLFFTIVGVLSLIAALSLPIIGHARFIALIDWFSKAPASVVRIWGFLGIAFAGSILYGSI